MHFYRVKVFSEPRGPWRPSLRLARLDAIELAVGAFDEDRRFYLSAGADIEAIHEYEFSRTGGERPASSTRTRGPAPLRVRARA